MKTIYKIGFAGIFLVVVLTGIFWLKPGSPLEKGMIIATSVPVKVDLLNDDLGIDNRYIPGSSIIALKNNDEKSGEPVLLTKDFYSARSPEVSYSGNFLVFSAQKAVGDTWQIYTMNLHSLDIRQVTQCPVNCTDPAWLPDGRIAFSRLNDEKATGPIHVLYACDPDGSNKKRLTFHPDTDISSSVFQDGRLLINSKQRFPEVGKMKMLALRIDGTKSELFFVNDLNIEPTGRAWEGPDGKVYFIEVDKDGQGPGNLACVDKGYPLSSYKRCSGDIKGDFHSTYPDRKGNLLVSYRESAGQTFGLHYFDIKNSTLGESIYSNRDFHIIEPVVIEERAVPMKLPVSVDESKEKGTLLCLNVDRSMDPVGNDENGKRKTAKVRVFGLEGMIGEIPVEDDGSFYIEINADTPVRFQTIDANGDALRGSSSWIWVMPNEKRSCIGCHEDRELAPDNKVPEALYAGMISLPEGTRTEAIAVNGKHMKK